MVFVYQGSGKKQNKDADISQRSCTKEACAIQYCLARNNYKEQRCEHVIQQWKSCCNKAKASSKETNN